MKYSDKTFNMVALLSPPALQNSRRGQGIVLCFISVFCVLSRLEIIYNWTAKSHPGYKTFKHCVTVCIYSILYFVESSALSWAPKNWQKIGRTKMIGFSYAEWSFLNGSKRAAGTSNPPFTIVFSASSFATSFPTVFGMWWCMAPQAHGAGHGSVQKRESKICTQNDEQKQVGEQRLAGYPLV